MDSSPSGSSAHGIFLTCPTLCDPIDRSPPGSPVPGILQARTLEWVAFRFTPSTAPSSFFSHPSALSHHPGIKGQRDCLWELALTTVLGKEHHSLGAYKIPNSPPVQKVVWHQNPSSPLALASVPQDQRLTPQDSPPRLPRCAGCQAGISPRMFSADLSLTAQEQEGQRGPRPRPLGSTSFLFSLHPALLWLTSCRGLRKWSGLGPRAGSLGPQSQHPDCNNGSFKYQEKRQTLTEAPGEQNKVREGTRNRGGGRECLSPRLRHLEAGEEGPGGAEQGPQAVGASGATVPAVIGCSVCL